MNILLIGNGFDLAHGLPTKYTDFLEFVKIIKKIKEVKEIRPFTRYEEIADKYNLHPCIKTSIYACFQEKLSKESKELLELVDKNFWLEYFLKNPMYQRENWIDFESEIGKVIRSTECDMRGKNFDGRIGDLTIKCLSDFYLYKEIREKRVDHITYRALRDALLKDLNRLIRIFEIYLCNYVENIPCNGILPDIQDARFDKILSFNYTDTYRKKFETKR